MYRLCIVTLSYGIAVPVFCLLFCVIALSWICWLPLRVFVVVTDSIFDDEEESERRTDCLSCLYVQSDLDEYCADPFINHELFSEQIC